MKSVFVLLLGFVFALSNAAAQEASLNGEWSQVIHSSSDLENAGSGIRIGWNFSKDRLTKTAEYFDSSGVYFIEQVEFAISLETQAQFLSLTKLETTEITYRDFEEPAPGREPVTVRYSGEGEKKFFVILGRDEQALNLGTCFDRNCSAVGESIQLRR